MTQYQFKRNGGFTLVEIAIVLVIIGLLLGGILKGQEMVTNAKIKRAVNDINGVTSAIYSYLDRYGMLPGDDDGASGRWSICGLSGTSVNGNGNGVIDGDWYSGNNNDESRKIWGHLRASGLINGSPDSCTQPTHAFGGRLAVEDTIFASNALRGTVICLEDLEGKIAEILDRQLDDGKPDTGNVMAATSTTAAPPSSWNLSTTYQLCKKL